MINDDWLTAKQGRIFEDFKRQYFMPDEIVKWSSTYIGYGLTSRGRVVSVIHEARFIKPMDRDTGSSVALFVNHHKFNVSMRKLVLNVFGEDLDDRYYTFVFKDGVRTNFALKNLVLKDKTSTHIWVYDAHDRKLERVDNDDPRIGQIRL